MTRISQPCLNASLSTNPFVARPFSGKQPIIMPLRLVKMAVSLKIKDYEGLGGFQLPKDQEEALSLFLSSPDFCRQVFVNSGKATVDNKDTLTAAYTGMLFQPVPWSPSTRKGMPQVSFLICFQLPALFPPSFARIVLIQKRNILDSLKSRKNLRFVASFSNAGYGKVPRQ